MTPVPIGASVLWALLAIRRFILQDASYYTWKVCFWFTFAQNRKRNTGPHFWNPVQRYCLFLTSANVLEKRKWQIFNHLWNEYRGNQNEYISEIDSLNFNGYQNSNSSTFENEKTKNENEKWNAITCCDFKSANDDNKKNAELTNFHVFPSIY